MQLYVPKPAKGTLDGCQFLPRPVNLQRPGISRHLQLHQRDGGSQLLSEDGYIRPGRV
jgi:hypothetical protein